MSQSSLALDLTAADQAHTVRRRTLLRGIGLSIVALGVSCGPAVPSQTPRLRRVGYLSRNSTPTIEPHIATVRKALGALGYVYGRDVVIEPRSSERSDELLPTLVEALIALPADVIMVEATPAALAAHNGTSRVPIVFSYVNDPVGQGLVTSLARPGANVTGVTTGSGALSTKRLELLKTVAPAAIDIAAVWDVTNPGQDLVMRDTNEIASKLELRIHPYGVHGAGSPEFDTQLSAIAAARPDAVMLMPSMATYETRFAQFAIAQHLPHLVSQYESVRISGALLGIGPDYTALTERAAALVDKILRGASPADVPVEDPTVFLTSVNLVTAARLGVTIPSDILRSATEVVR